MAKIFKIDGYVIGNNGNYDYTDSVDDELEKGLYDGSFCNFSTKTTKVEWYDDIDINSLDATKEDFEKYFEKDNVKVIKADDWEGLYINGKLIDEGHTLNEGDERVLYFADLAKRCNFDLSHIKFYWIDDEDEQHLENLGNFPEDIDKLIGDYDSAKNENRID